MTVFTDTGEAHAVDQWDAAGHWVAQGTGTQSEIKTRNALAIEASESRVSTTDTQPTADAIRHVGTIVADGTKTITEAGIFDASTAGNCLLYDAFTGIAVVLNDSIEFTFDLEFA